MITRYMQSTEYESLRFKSSGMGPNIVLVTSQYYVYVHMTSCFDKHETGAFRQNNISSIHMDTDQYRIDLIVQHWTNACTSISKPDVHVHVVLVV